MTKNCVYLKQKMNRTLYCKKQDKIITFKECFNCKNLDKNFLCGHKKDNPHEVYEGHNRINSMKYGCVMPLCFNHHREIHKNSELAN